MQIGPKKTIFKRLYQHFFRTSGLQDKLLISIESPNIFHWKPAKKVKWVWSVERNLGQIWYNVVPKKRETGISMFFFFDILDEVYILKHEAVFIKKSK